MRGLPHAHIAVRLEGAQPDTSELVDRYISCEVPDQVLQPELHALVTTHMVHRRCVEGRCYKATPAGAPATTTTTGGHGPGRTRTRDCKYGFPFPCQAETTFDDSGRCWHRRRTAADRNIVAYNGPMLLTFKCHINVQVASGAKLIRYLFKYQHKMPQTVGLATTLGPDGGAAPAPPSEYQTFETERYICSSEALWRTMAFDVNGCDPVVDAVGSHLPQRDYVMFGENDNLAARAAAAVSPQTRWLLRPRGPDFDNLSFKDYHAAFNHAKEADAPKTKPTEEDGVPAPHTHLVWRRTKEHCVRVHTAFLTQGQPFYFRKLLVASSGARSYHALATVAGVTYYLPTPAGSPPVVHGPVESPEEEEEDVMHAPADLYDFHAAAIAAGLVEDGHEIQSALQEAVDRQETPPSLRRLFVHLLMESGVESHDTPDQLLTQFFDHLSRDFTLLLPSEYNIIPMTDPNRVRQAVLCELRRHAALAGATLASLRLQEPAPAYAGAGGGVAPRPTPAAWRAKYDSMAAAITAFPEQQAILTAALHLLYPAPGPPPAHGSRLLFIDAPAGRGKSYVLNCIEAYVWSRGDEVAASAHAGIAASDHFEGSTMHRLYGLPVGLTLQDTADTMRSTITRDSAQAARLRAATLLVLDEVATVHFLYLEVIDRLLRGLMQLDVPFGGKVVIAAGDFRQTTVVVVSGTREQVVRSSVKAFPLWHLFTTMALTVPVRNAADPELDRFCELVGVGTAPRCTRAGVPLTPAETALSVAVGGEHNILLPACLARRVHFFTEAPAFLDYVHPFASLQDPLHASTAVLSAVIAGHNVVVDEHNAVYLESLPGVLHTLTAAETIPRDSDGVDTDFLSEDFLAAMHEPGKPPHLLHLKANAYVTALRNMPLGSQVLNGTRMRVLWVGRFILKVAVMDKDGGVVVETLIPRVTFPITLPKSNIVVHRRQFPVKLSYASTIHKQQGKGCPAREGIDLRRPFFGHGTNYTGFTRAAHADRLALLVNAEDMVLSPEDGVTMTVVLTNVVYPELLSNAPLPSMALMPQPAPVNPPPPLGPGMQELLAWQGYGDHPATLDRDADGADAAAVLPPDDGRDVDQGDGSGAGVA